MKQLVIIGCGAVAAEVCSYVDDINKLHKEKINVLGFLNDDFDSYIQNKVRYNLKAPFLGAIDSFDFSEDMFCMIGFANIEKRITLLERVFTKNLKFMNIIHPTSQIADSAKIGVGNVIYPNCVIGPNANVGNNNLITSYSFISHDCTVGNNNFLSTSGLSGNVKVGDNNFFGIRATIIPDVEIGNHNVIQAGMIIDKNVSNHETVFYRFKEKVAFINKK